MGKSESRKISIHPLLWKLHGKQAYPEDLALVYTLAMLTLAFNCVMGGSMPGWKWTVLAILSLDIGGGVVSNFTQGTITYYSQAKSSPHAFIWLHLLQGLALSTIFWDSSFEILSVVLLTLIFSSSVISLRNTRVRQSAASFFLGLSTLAIALCDLSVPCFVLLLLLGVKLIIGFSANFNPTIRT